MAKEQELNERNKELDYIGNCLAALEELPFGQYSADGKLLRKFWMNGEEMPELFREYLLDAIHAMDERHVIRTKVKDLPVAMWVYLSDDGNYYVWGPVQYQTFTAKEILLYDRDIRPSCPGYQIYSTTYEKVLAHISCFAFAIDHRQFAAADMQEYAAHEITSAVIQQQNIDHVYRTADGMLSNHSYSDEQYPLEMLRNGDLDGIQRYIHLRRLDYPDVFPNDKKKNEEYMAVASVGIMTRCAIEAGAPASECYRLSDVFLGRISSCKDVGSILSEREEALVMFTKLVSRHRTIAAGNPYVEDCRKDIARRIYEPISLEDIAQDLGVRSTYLARLFKESEGISVGKFIRKEKIRLAMEMLRYSSRSVSEIADYLGFSSQSYFGKIFKEETGTTPDVYRRQNRASDF